MVVLMIVFCFPLFHTFSKIHFILSNAVIWQSTKDNNNNNNKKTQLENVLHRLHPRRTLSNCLSFTCANCSWNSLTSSNNPSSLILDVLSGQSLKCCFRILQYWFSGSLSSAHRFVIAFSLTQYSTIKSSVSATMAYSSL